MSLAKLVNMTVWSETEERRTREGSKKAFQLLLDIHETRKELIPRRKEKKVGAWEVGAVAGDSTV